MVMCRQMHHHPASKKPTLQMRLLGQQHLHPCAVLIVEQPPKLSAFVLVSFERFTVPHCARHHRVLLAAVLLSLQSAMLCWCWVPGFLQVSQPIVRNREAAGSNCSQRACPPAWHCLHRTGQDRTARHGTQLRLAG